MSESPICQKNLTVLSMLSPSLRPGQLSTSLQGEPRHEQFIGRLDDINKQPGLIVIELGFTLGNHHLPQLRNWMNSSPCCLTEK